MALNGPCFLVFMPLWNSLPSGVEWPTGWQTTTKVMAVTCMIRLQKTENFILLSDSFLSYWPWWHELPCWSAHVWRNWRGPPANGPQGIKALSEQRLMDGIMPITHTSGLRRGSLPSQIFTWDLGTSRALTAALRDPEQRTLLSHAKTPDPRNSKTSSVCF